MLVIDETNGFETKTTKKATATTNYRDNQQLLKKRILNG